MNKEPQPVTDLTNASEQSVAPTYHGLFSDVPPAGSGQIPSATQIPSFRCGMQQLLWILNFGFVNDDVERRLKAARLSRHLTHALERFTYSLQELNLRMQNIAARFDKVGTLVGASHAFTEAGSLADSTLMYLGIFVDDIALLVTTVFPTPKKAGIDSMGSLKGNAKLPELKEVSELLLELDQSGSWYDIGFRKRHGMRQLIVHHNNIITLQVNKHPEGKSMIHGYISDPTHTTKNSSEYFKSLQKLLLGLCLWLDRLYLILLEHLGNPTNTPPPSDFGLILPIGFRKGTTKLVNQYFPIPVCSKSQNLPWRISIRATKTGLGVKVLSTGPYLA